MFRPRNIAITSSLKKLHDTERRYRWALEGAKDMLEVAQYLPDELTPGTLEVEWWGSDIEMTVPYDLAWFISYKGKLLDLGWEYEGENKVYQTPEDTRRVHDFSRVLINEQGHYDRRLRFELILDAKDKDAVCQLIQVGKKRKYEIVPIYEIVCEEGENVLDGEVVNA